MIIKPAVIPATTMFPLPSRVNWIDVIIIKMTTMISLNKTPLSNNNAVLKPLLILVCINKKNAGPNPKIVARVKPISAPWKKTISVFCKTYKSTNIF